MPATTVSHLGICVSQLERSQRFYTEVFGFRVCARLEPGRELADLVGLHGELAMKCQFLEKDGLLIELVEYTQPGAVAAESPQRANRIGYTHLSFRVQNADEIAEKMIAFGGQLHRQTRIADPFLGLSGVFVFGSDPDGTRIELMQLPDEVQFQ